MTPGPLTSPPVLDQDVLDALRALGGSDPAAFMRELFTTLFEQSAAAVTLCRDPAADPAAVKAAGHRLKGAAGTVGAMRLSAAAEALEAGAHDIERRSALLRNLQAELDVVRTRVDC